jgi:hypothetical protein
LREAEDQASRRSDDDRNKADEEVEDEAPEQQRRPFDQRSYDPGMTGLALCFGGARGTREYEDKDCTVPRLQAERDRKATFSLGASRDPLVER